MRLLIIFFLLIIPTKFLFADNIRNFEIESISVGNSLLNYYSEEQINNAEMHVYSKSKDYPNTKFLILRLQNDLNLKQYEDIQFVVLKDDKKKIIHAVEGFIYYRNNINECNDFKDIIVNDIKNQIDINKVQVYNNESKHGQDKSGKSIVEETIFLFSSGAVFRVSCTDWSKEMNFIDELRVVINSVKFSNYLRSLYQ